MDDVDLLDHLLRLALEADQQPISEEAETRLLGDLRKPRFHAAVKVHDWRNHVPEVLQELWDELPVLAQLTAFIGAAHKASSESW